MNWTKITITTTENAEESVSAMLLGLGFDQIEIENNIPPSDEDFSAMYIDPQPELLPDEDAESSLPDGTSLISFYIEEGEVTKDVLDSLVEDIEKGLSLIAEYADIGTGLIEISESREDDWRNNWKKFYKPLLIGNILIKPSWEPVPDEYAEQIADGSIKLIEMEPGTAFGTGTHETTRLCVEGLDKYLKAGDAVLDIGTGSGILGLCALAQGASWVMATELDPDCEHIIIDNLAMNNISSGTANVTENGAVNDGASAVACADVNDTARAEFVLSIGNILDEKRVRNEVISAGKSHHLEDGFDIIVANILAPVIIELLASGQADFFIKKGGFFITSGIIDEKEASVVEALKANPCWELVETVHCGEWVSVIARAV